MSKRADNRHVLWPPQSGKPCGDRRLPVIGNFLSAIVPLTIRSSSTADSSGKGDAKGLSHESNGRYLAWGFAWGW